MLLTFCIVFNCRVRAIKNFQFSFHSNKNIVKISWHIIKYLNEKGIKFRQCSKWNTNFEKNLNLFIPDIMYDIFFKLISQITIERCNEISYIFEWIQGHFTS